MNADDADDAWDELNDALKGYTPPCHGSSLFTADRLTEGERELCKSMCARCRVVDLCEAYATASESPGFWGGHYYSTKGQKLTAKQAAASNRQRKTTQQAEP